jgi:sporulation protein YlmC with PRC-barrel domain
MATFDAHGVRLAPTDVMKAVQIDLVRDVLDKSVVDRNGREMGRVDGTLVEFDDGPPRITALLIGPVALGSRIHPALGRVIGALERRLGIDRERPTRIATSDIEQLDRKVRLRLTIGETAAGAVEQLLRRWLVKVPGSQ